MKGNCYEKSIVWHFCHSCACGDLCLSYTGASRSLHFYHQGVTATVREGDFIKGVYVSVLLDLFTSGPTRNRTEIGWMPLTRDGGQKLGRKFDIYNMTSDNSINFR